MILRHEVQGLGAEQARPVDGPISQQHLAEAQIVGGRREQASSAREERDIAGPRALHGVIDQSE